MRNPFRRAESRSLPGPENELPLLATYSGTNITPTATSKASPSTASSGSPLKFELDSLLRADAATRSEVYARALDPVNGWMTREEVRELEEAPWGGWNTGAGIKPRELATREADVVATEAD